MARSQAVAGFRRSVAVASELLRIEGGYVDPPQPVHQAAVSGLRGGAAVMMVASFEDYVRTLLLEWLSVLTSLPPRRPFTNLPEKLQASSLKRSFNLALYGSRHGPPPTHAERVAAVRRAATLVAAGVIDHMALCDTGGNPSPAQLKEMLNEIGLQDPFAKLKPVFEAKQGGFVAHTFVWDKLEEIVKRRHRVAHTADTLTISRKDLAESVQFLLHLADALDEVVEAHVYSM